MAEVIQHSAMFPNGELGMSAIVARFKPRKSEHDQAGLVADCPVDHGIPSVFDLKETSAGWRITMCELGCLPREIWAASAPTPRDPGEDDGEEQEQTLSVTAAQFYASCDASIEWLFAPYVFKSGFTLVQGAPKSGKTWLVAWIAACAAAQGHRVLFVEEEGAKETLRDRLRPFTGADPSPLLRIAYRKRVRLDASGSVEALIAEVQLHKAALVVLDPFVALHSKREKEQDEMAMVLGAIRDMISATGCAVLLVHHTRKGDSWDKGSNGDAQSADARGSGALVGDVDLVIAVKGLPTAKRKDGEVALVVENPDTRMGAPFGKKTISFNLSDGTMHEEEERAPETPEELLARLLPILPAQPQVIGQQDARKALRVKLDRLREAIYLGIQQGCIISTPKGMSRAQHNP